MKKIILSLVSLTFFVTGLCVLAAPIDISLPLKGSTISNIKLQSDTLIPVFTAVTLKTNGCQNLSVINTEVIKHPYNTKISEGKYIAGIWEELWTVNACGKNVYVPITFVIDSTGTTYIIKNDKIKM